MITCDNKQFHITLCNDKEKIYYVHNKMMRSLFTFEAVLCGQISY